MKKITFLLFIGLTLIVQARSVTPLTEEDYVDMLDKGAYSKEPFDIKNSLAIKSVEQMDPVELQHKLTGMWAMMPLNNGIANVVEFDGIGVTKNNTFHCEQDKTYIQEQPSVSYGYRLVKDNRIEILHLNGKNKGEVFTTLEINHLDTPIMLVTQHFKEPELINTPIQLAYSKVTKKIPLCMFYK